MRSLIAKFIPQYCEVCRFPISSSPFFCSTCYSKLPWHSHGLSPTIKLPNYFSALAYQYPINTYITQLKFHQQLRYAKLLGTLFAEEASRHHIELPDIIIPIPLHKKRLQQRGFNQALALAKHISQQLHIPVDYRLISRIKNTQPQTELTAKERKRNCHRAFKRIKPHSYQHIALLDDVITTSHTMQHTLQALKITPPIKISCWSIATTPSNP